MLLIFTDADFLTDNDFNLGGRRVPLSPNIEPLETLFFAKTKDLDIYTGFNLWASYPGKEYFRPIHHLLIYTDTDSNRFWGLLTLPIPIFRYEFHTESETSNSHPSSVIILAENPNPPKGTDIILERSPNIKIL